jgi:hypothetical protein
LRSLRSLTAPLAALCAIAATTFFATPVAGQEHITNGGFENGTAPWVLFNASVADCDAGNGLRLAPPANQHGFGRQRIEGPLAAGTYRISGKVKRLTGNTSARLGVTWLDTTDQVVDAPEPSSLPAATSYTPFQFEFEAAPNAFAAVIGFSVTSGTSVASFCIDDVSIDGPPLATATPIPTDTPPATSTPTVGPSSTISPTPAATVTATKTPQPTLGFRNGSFEDGITGWQKFGGELGITDTPRVSGLRAGVLSSSTASTKWAYQTVAIEPLRHYQFSGHLQAGPGLSSALLRISWYASPDGSGEALSTTDSTSSISAGTAGYVLLTTGPVQPPAGAKTARPRVLFTPAGAAEATLYMDDLDFLVEAATAIPAATSAPAVAISTVAPAAATPVPLRTTPVATVVSTPAVVPEPTRVSEVSSARVVATPTAVAEVRGVRTEPPADGGGVPLIWLVGTGALVVGLGGAYMQKRRRM